METIYGGERSATDNNIVPKKSYQGGFHILLRFTPYNDKRKPSVLLGEETGYMLKYFSKFARYIAQVSGAPSAFILACFFVALWVVSGPFFSFSDTWQLIINTVTNIIALLMVFIIQNTQNRDGEAMQIKLDELIRAHKDAHNVLLDLEELTQDQLDVLKKKYEILAREARKELIQGKKDTRKRSIYTRLT